MLGSQRQRPLRGKSWTTWPAAVRGLEAAFRLLMRRSGGKEVSHAFIRCGARLAGAPPASNVHHVGTLVPLNVLSDLVSICSGLVKD